MAAAPGNSQGACHIAMTTPEETCVQIRCPICLEGIFPCEAIKASFCRPIEHVVHESCWWDQPGDQQERCCICRQREVSRPTAFMLYERFPATSQNLSFEDLCGEPTMDWLSPVGKGLLHGYVRGELTPEDLARMARVPRRRPNVENAIREFVASRKRQRA